MTESVPDLQPFFAPRSVALVGATDDLTKFGGRCLQQLLHFGYDGAIYPVNPRRDEVRGLKCYGSVRDLPEAPDHVGIVVPSDRVFDVLSDCAARGARFATIFTAGFGETGTDRGRALQAELRAFASQSGIRLMGPNCNGLINFVQPFALTSTAAISGPRQPAGDVAVVANSGGAAQVNTMWRAQQAGLKISYEVSCGNDADLDALDFARFMVEDDASRVVLLVLERIGDGGKFIKLAQRAAEKGKPLLIVKVGRTEEGSRAAASHTGAVTGSDAVQDAAFRQFGLIRTDDCNEMYHAAMLLRTGKLPAGPNLASMSLSGGNVVLLTDLGSQMGLRFAPYDESTQEEIGKLMPGYGRVANPTDLTAAAIGSPDTYQKVLETITADPNVDLMVPILTFAPRADINKIVEVADGSSKPVAVLWTGACLDDDSDIRVFTRAGVPAFRDPLPCLKAIARTERYARYLDRYRSRQAPRRPVGIDCDLAQKRLREAGKRLTERQSKAVLAAYGLAVLREELATDPAAAVQFADEVRGPVALKIESVDIPHKTEAGAIRLGLRGAEAVTQGFNEVMAAAKAWMPDARLDGVLVQEMAPPAGVELILGISRDPDFGPVVMAGLGGIHVEVLRDVSFRIPPFDPDEANRMLRELRAAPLLDGARGQPPRDVAALCDAAVRLSWLAHDLGDEIAELDINPLVVLEAGAGVRVVDALVVPAGSDE